MEKNGTDGHYYTSCFLKDTSGKGQWVLIDSDRKVDDPREVRLQKMNLDNRNIDTDYYAFAYTKDYGEIEYKGVQIDSIQTMNEVQRMAYEDCDEQDFSLGKDNNIER